MLFLNYSLVFLNFGPMLVSFNQTCVPNLRKISNVRYFKLGNDKWSASSQNNANVAIFSV